MKKFSVFFFISIVSIVITSLSYAKDDTTENRTAAAKEYLKLVPVTETFVKSMNLLKENTCPKLEESKVELCRKAFDKMANHSKFKKLEELSLEALIKHFNVEEIELLAQFMGSSLGKSIQQKYPAYIADVIPSVQALVKEAQQEVEKELKKSE